MAPPTLVNDDDGDEVTPLLLGVTKRQDSAPLLEISKGRHQTGHFADRHVSRTHDDDGSSALWAYKIASRIASLRSGTNKRMGPSIKDAFTYFEYVTLPRRLKVEGAGKDAKYSKAVSGDWDDDIAGTSSTLYPAWTTPQRALSDFGTGIAVYFETLLYLTGVCFLAGVLYLPTIIYYGSDGYTSESVHTILGPLRGSMICPRPEFVPCPTCTAEAWLQYPGRLGYSNFGADGSLIFALKNTCSPLQWSTGGFNHLVVMVFLSVAIFYLGYYQQQSEKFHDECVLTAQDFSIQVNNPPNDATDAEEWKSFFEQFGSVAMVTVSLDNSLLLRKLNQRRTLLRKAWYLLVESEHDEFQRVLHLSHDEDETDELDYKVASGTKLMPRVQDLPATFQESHPKLYQQLNEMDALCRELIQKSYPTSAIFVTFEKEYSQRKALEKLQVGQFHVESNDPSCFDGDDRFLFRGSLVLDVFEAPEPSAIRWQELSVSRITRLLQRFVTWILTVGTVVAGFVIVKWVHDNIGVNTAGSAVALLNILVPYKLKYINGLESHQSEDTCQASWYWKNSVFRWVNTGIVTILITPFTNTLTDSMDGLVTAVHAVLRAEILIGPTIRMLDIGGNLKRLVLAPLLAKNQAAMNSYFRGSQQYLGEKYTNVTKTIFLVFFYSVIFPSGFFYGAAALWLTYVTDKFSLLRSWAPMPRMGNAVAELSRVVFFPLCLGALAIMSFSFISSYPFDNLCPTNKVVKTGSGSSVSGYIGSHTVHLMTVEENFTNINDGVKVTVFEGDDVYKYCDQDFETHMGKMFQWNLTQAFEPEDAELAVTESWMLGDQRSMTLAFGLLATSFAGFLLLRLFGKNIQEASSEALGGFATDELDSGESYSNQPRIRAYLPIVFNKEFLFPLVAVDRSSNFEHSRHLAWNRDNALVGGQGYEFYDLSQDVEDLTIDDGETSNKTLVLSIVRQFY